MRHKNQLQTTYEAQRCEYGFEQEIIEHCTGYLFQCSNHADLRMVLLNNIGNIPMMKCLCSSG